jgi:hypothetical protein
VGPQGVNSAVSMPFFSSEKENTLEGIGLAVKGVEISKNE